MKTNNTHLIYNILIESKILPVEIINYIFNIMFDNGCAILYDRTILNENENNFSQQYYYPNLLSVMIPKNILSLDKCAFLGNKYLKNPNFHDDILRISHSAYENCDKISEITLPKNLKYLGDKVFKDCFNLTKFTLNENIQYLGQYILMNTKIEYLEIPKTIKVIDRLCFSDMSHVKHINILGNFRINDLKHSYWDDKNDEYVLNMDEGYSIINLGAFWCNDSKLEKITLNIRKKRISEYLWNQIFPKDTYNWNENIIDLGNGIYRYSYTKN
jgi:hypothetical protein